MQPAGLRFGLTTEAAGQAFVAEITEAIRQRRGVGMSPLLVSAWKSLVRKRDPTKLVGLRPVGTLIESTGQPVNHLLPSYGPRAETLFGQIAGLGPGIDQIMDSTHCDRAYLSV
jgi:hypothetical protein